MAETLETLKANGRQVREFTIDCMQAGVVPFIQGSPGIGKSAIIKSIAKEYRLKLIDHRLSTSAPEDLTGLPEFRTSEDGVRKASFAPFDIFPVEGDKIPENYDGWLVFLDELNAAPKSVQAAAYKLILDRYVGQNKVHQNVVMVAAGNLATDRAITNALSTAMQSRLVHIEMELNRAHFMEDVVLSQKWDSRIHAFLSYRPGAIYDFRPDHNEKTFCCPRTWEFMNRLIQGKQFTLDEKGYFSMQEKAPLYQGTITSGTALEFITFCKVFKELPSFTEIIRAPETTPISTDRATQFAVISYVIENAKDDNLEKVMIYIGRFSVEFRTMFYRALLIRSPGIRHNPHFRPGLVQIGQFIHE